MVGKAKALKMLLDAITGYTDETNPNAHQDYIGDLRTSMYIARYEVDLHKTKLTATKTKRKAKLTSLQD